MIDKGPRAFDVLALLMAVREDARRKGGIVILLAGNHEAEFLADPSAPKGKEFAAQLKAAHLDPAETGACDNAVGRFLCSLAFAARVSDWFFSHAGNAGGRTLGHLKLDIQNGIDRDGYRTRQLLDGNSLLEARLDEEGPHGKPWIDQKVPDQRMFDRKTADEGPGERTLLAEYAAALGVSHIVEGHKPSDVTFADGIVRRQGEMFQRFGLLFLIDTGMSEGVGYSRGAVLHITAGGRKAVAICPNGTTTNLWEPNITSDFGRAAACQK